MVSQPWTEWMPLVESRGGEGKGSLGFHSRDTNHHIFADPVFLGVLWLIISNTAVCNWPRTVNVFI